ARGRDRGRDGRAGGLGRDPRGESSPRQRVPHRHPAGGPVVAGRGNPRRRDQQAAPRRDLGLAGLAFRPMAVPRTITLGDVEVPRIGLGTNRLAHTAENVELIQEGVAAGLRHIDTAHTYARGQSEETIGEALALHHDGTVVATKGGGDSGWPGAIREQIEESLRRLEVEAIDLYYFHRPDPETPLEASLGPIKEAVDAGSIRHFGLSSVSIEQLERGRSVVPVTAVQNHFNLSERG